MEKIRGQLEILQTVIDRLPVALFVKSGRPEDFGRFLLVNKLQQEVLGLAADEMIGRNDHELFPVDQADYFREMDQSTFASGSLVNITEEPVDTPTGRIHLHTRKFPIYDQEGNPDYLIGISQDITERKKYEQSINVREQNMAVLLRAAEGLLSSPDWRDVMQSAMKDLGGINEMDSVWVQRVVEGDAGERLGRLELLWNKGGRKNSGDTLSLSEPYLTEYMRRLDAGRIVHFRRENVSRDIVTIFRLYKAQALMLAPIMVGGVLWGAIGMATRSGEHAWSAGEHEVVKTLANVLASFLAREQTDRELKLAESRLLRAAQMETLGKLAGGIAHDFNNMLTSIMGFSQLALDQVGPEHPVRGDLEEVLHVGEQAAQLSRQMLVLSRKNEVTLAPIDLCDAVRGFDRIFRRPLSAQFELVTLLGEPTWVTANREQLELVIMNLAINARDAMLPEGGKITVSVRKEVLGEGPLLPEGFEPGEYAELIVMDDGPGIPEEIQKQVFDPFFTTKAEDKGTGLGLSTTQQVVDQYGGFLHLFSKEGVGAAFHLYFPSLESPGMVAPAPSNPNAAQEGEESILVVEDEATLRHLTQRILERLGYRVDVRSSGSEAYSYLLTERPSFDLILCDVVMPHMSGPEMVRRLEEEGVHYPVLFMSGYTANNIDQQGFRLDGCSLLPKPFSRVELAQKIRQTLMESGLADATN